MVSAGANRKSRVGKGRWVGMVRVSLCWRWPLSQDLKEMRECLIQKFGGRPEERKEEPGDFYRCPSVLWTTALNCQVLQQLWTSFPRCSLSISHHNETYPSFPVVKTNVQEDGALWRPPWTFLQNTLDLPSFSWMPRRSFSLKSGKKLK